MPLSLVPYILAGASLLAFSRTYQLGRRDFTLLGRLTPAAFVWLLLAYTGMTTAVAAAVIVSPATVDLSTPVAIGLGGGLIVAGLVMYLSARITLRSFRTAWALRVDELITTGPYRLSRNPLVVGLVGILLGASVAARSLGAIVLSGVYVWMSALWIRLEEAVLLQQFGRAYEQYCQKVRRVL
jgi:protein-S-isoprenylcysteine O-methyltransferase Ste14